MKKRIISAILAVFVMFSIMFFQGITISQAVNGATVKSQFTGQSANATEGQTAIKKIIGPVLSVTRIAAYGIALVMITYIGIKYMMASPSEKGDLKSQLITFTVGAVILFGAGSLLGVIKTFATTL